jgi:hypothetical protein
MTDDAKALKEMLDESLPESTEKILEAKGLPIVKVDVPPSSRRRPRSSVAGSAYTKKWQKNHGQRKAARKRAKKSRRRNRK